MGFKRFSKKKCRLCVESWSTIGKTFFAVLMKKYSTSIEYRTTCISFLYSYIVLMLNYTFFYTNIRVCTHTHENVLYYKSRVGVLVLTFVLVLSTFYFAHTCTCTCTHDNVLYYTYKSLHVTQVSKNLSQICKLPRR